MGGTALFLTGPMGVGKTATSLALQHLLPGIWLRWEVDRAQPKASGPLIDLLPPAELIGTQDRMLRANLTAVRAYVEQGWSVIAEIGIFDDDLEIVRSVWDGHNVRVAALVASYETTCQHVRADGRTRPAHLSSYESFIARTPTWADVIVSADNASVDQLAAQIASVMR